MSIRSFITLFITLLVPLSLCFAEDPSINFTGWRFLYGITSFSMEGGTPGIIHRLVIDDQHDELYIADNTNHSIYVTQKQGGVPLGVFKHIGDHIYDMALDRQGRLFVSLGKEVRILNYKGDAIGKVDLTVAHGPEGMVVAAMHIDEDGALYMGDNILKRVVVLDKNGRFLFQFDKASDKKFIGITDIKTDADHIYVMDQTKAKISVFDREGRFLRWWGELSSLQGGFSQPVRIDIDSTRGIVYALDSNRSMVIAFDKKGAFLFEFGGLGAGRGFFYTPHDVKIDKSGRVYVADPANGVVQVIEPLIEESLKEEKGPQEQVSP